MIRNAKVVLRNAGIYLTQIDVGAEPPKSIAQRMGAGGTIICEEQRWGKRRILIINLTDVICVEIDDVTP